MDHNLWMDDESFLQWLGGEVALGHIQESQRNELVVARLRVQQWIARNQDGPMVDENGQPLLVGSFGGSSSSVSWADNAPEDVLERYGTHSMLAAQDDNHRSEKDRRVLYFETADGRLLPGL